MVARGRITPIAVVGALIIMIAALLYAAINRTHETPTQAPVQQKR